MSQHGDVATGPGWELRCGRWQDVLGDAVDLWDGRCYLPVIPTADSLISDPPYSPRQKDGFRSSNDLTRKDGPRSGRVTNGTITCFQGMPYSPMSQDFADEIAAKFSTLNWAVLFGDHISFRWWERAMLGAGRYVFAPVVWIRGNAPRFQGDGPCSAAEYICVSRPRRKTSCGSLPGFYNVQPLRGEIMHTRIVTGQKPIPLMRALVRDYSRPGDLIVDPCAGSGATLLAAVIEGRRAIGAEMDPKTFDLARKRLEAGYTPTLPMTSESTAEQVDLFDPETK